MDSELETDTDPPGHQAARIQSRIGVTTDDLLEAEQDPEVRRAAERIRRMQGDQVLMMRLEVSGFRGKEWREFEDVLIDYGNGVMMGWSMTGQVFAKLREKGLARLHPPDGGLMRPDAVDLVQETLGIAIPKFRDEVLRRGKWRPEKGANLTTFFIGQCLIQFPNAYQRWLGERRRQQLDDLRDPINVPIRRFEPLGDPEHVALMAAELETALDRIQDDVTRRIVAYNALGYTHPEISNLMGVTEAMVKTRLHRYRRRCGEGT